MYEFLTFLVGSGLLKELSLPLCSLVGPAFEIMVCSPNSEYITLERLLVSDNENVTNISLRGCNIIKIGKEPFINLTSLKSLDLSYNSLTSAEGLEGDFPKLTSLNISYNFLTGFELAFSDLKPNLEVLDASYNDISFLQLGVLDGFQNLKVLNLSDNLLVSFPLGLFDQKPNLEYLILSRNGINNLELGVFDPLTRLKHVDLADNRLTGKDLSPWLFDKSPSVEYIDFSLNNMTQTPDNLLHAFRALRFLILDTSSLNKVPEFATQPNLSTLKHLVLSNNLIETIPTNAFKGTSIQYLNLGNNMFSFLPDKFIFQLRQSGTFIRNLNINDNPWQCACLLDILNEIKLYRIIYNSTNYDGTYPVCVAESVYNCNRDKRSNMYYADVYNELVHKIP